MTPVAATGLPRECASAAPERETTRVQEWLTLHGFRVVIDGVIGAATRAALSQFQAAHGLAATGICTAETWAALIAPMAAAARLVPVTPGEPFGRVVVAVAEQHLRHHPREVGGPNRGVWVRFYMAGEQGTQWPWCAGFASTVVNQAAASAGLASPVPYTPSCDVLAQRAASVGRLYRVIGSSNERPVPGDVFLVRRSPVDWVHTGIVRTARGDSFSSIEGNTNDDGAREGYEVAALTRAYTAKDFIRVGTSGPPRAVLT